MCPRVHEILKRCWMWHMRLWCLQVMTPTSTSEYNVSCYRCVCLFIFSSTSTYFGVRCPSYPRVCLFIFFGLVLVNQPRFSLFPLSVKNILLTAFRSQWGPPSSYGSAKHSESGKSEQKKISSPPPSPPEGGNKSGAHVGTRVGLKEATGGN